MKKALLILTAIILFCQQSYAVDSDNISLLTKKGFFDNPNQPAKQSFKNSLSFSSNPCEEVKNVLYTHLKYANTYNFDALKSLYADNYSNADGLNKNIYFDLIKKTWDSYPNIKYKMDIRNIEVNDNIAVAQVNEEAFANTNSASGITGENGFLESKSISVYYLEKIRNEWLVTSDHIIFEKTFLGYGSAKDIQIDLTAPPQITANTQYTAVLKMNPPKDSLVIASIGKENITYPQTIAEEVFRKLPDDGILERVFTSNQNNINEYAVASFGITRAEMSKSKEIKVYITGLGFMMTRVNVIPKNEFIKEIPIETAQTQTAQNAKIKGEKINDEKIQLEKTK